MSVGLSSAASVTMSSAERIVAEFRGEPNLAHIITVAGGKGGVGKSIIASNLSIAMAQLGRRVVLVDLDLGAANQHLLLGLKKAPAASVADLLDGSEQDLQAALTPTSVPNLHLVVGTGATVGAANISHTDKRRLLRKLRALDAVVVLDVGAGVHYNAIDFFLLGPQKLIVATPQVTSIHDVYSFLKGAVLRMLKQQAGRAIEAALLEPALLSRESANVRTILTRLRQQRPEFAEKVASLMAMFGASLVGNQVSTARESGVFPSVAKMVKDYLGIELPVLGWMRASQRIHDSVNERRPVMLGAPCAETESFVRMASRLLEEDPRSIEELPEIVLEDAPELTPEPQPALGMSATR